VFSRAPAMPPPDADRHGETQSPHATLVGGKKPFHVNVRTTGERIRQAGWNEFLGGLNAMESGQGAAPGVRPHVVRLAIVP
jgi:hypothetical protein